MPDTTRPPFDAYALPLPRRREGRAAAASLVAHVLIAILVLWRGAELVEAGGGGGTGPRGGGGGGGRPAMSWFALPAPTSPAVHDVPPAPPPTVTVPTIAPPVTEPVRLQIPPPAAVTTPPAAVGTGNGTVGGPGEGPGSGGGKGTGTGTGAGPDSGSGSGGPASDVQPAIPLLMVNPPPGAPREIHGQRYEVRFWVTTEGQVSRVEVMPPIKDAGYRREFTIAMMGYQFRPARARDGRSVAYIASITVYP